MGFGKVRWVAIKDNAGHYTKEKLSEMDIAQRRC